MRNKRNRQPALIILLLGAIALISCGSVNFKTLQEADCYLARNDSVLYGEITYIIDEPVIRKNETAANTALRMTGLIEDNKPLPVSQKELSTPYMYGAGGHKAPFWDIAARITFNRKKAIIRTEAGKQPSNIIEAAVGRVGQPPKVPGCLVEKIRIVPCWPSEKYEGPDGSILISSGVSVHLLYSASQNSHTSCDRDSGREFTEYMRKISESIKADLERVSPKLPCRGGIVSDPTDKSGGLREP